MMGIEYLLWKYSGTHNGNRSFTMGILYNPRWEWIIYNGNIAEHAMGIKHLQWEHCITHVGNRIFTMGTLYNPRWE